MNNSNYLNLTGTMIGYYFPFFLNNSRLSDSYYLYQITTPALNEDLIPYLSMVKISEKTKPDQPSGKGIDILSACLGNKKNMPETGIDFLSNLLKKEDTKVVGNSKEFPWITMVPGNNLQKTMIIGLRDSLRWKNYKFFPDRYVDLLWTVKDYIVLKICGDQKGNLWFEHVGAYRNNDVNMENPIKVDWNRINYPREKFGGPSKASDINRTLKRLEWNSFERRAFRQL